MINLEINKQSYSVIESWSEMTLDKGSLLSAICLAAPDKLKDYYSILASPGSKEAKDEAILAWSEAVGEEEIIKGFPEFYGKVIGCLSNIPEEVLKYVNTGYRVAFFKQHCELFVIGILHEPINYEAKNILSFIHGEKEYFLPLTRTVLGNEKPMSDRTTIEFTESADLQLASKKLKAGKLEFAANIISILCRPHIPNVPLPPQGRLVIEPGLFQGKKAIQKLHDAHAQERIDAVKNHPRTILEPYNEKICLERSETFKSLTMDIVFEVFFCLAKLTLLSNQRIQISSLQEAVNGQKQELKEMTSKHTGGTHGSSQLRVV